MYPLMDSLTSAQMLLFFGVASGVLSTFAYIPYILDTVARRTEPQRASWLIWSVLGSIAFVSQVFEGATSSLWFAGVQITGTIIVFVLSIWVGKGRFLSKSDCLILVAASIGLLLWYLTDNAAYALAITISISLLGGMATVVKAYRDPESETLVTWVVSFIASACAIFSVGALDLTLLAYPLYLFTLYLAFIVAIVLGRARNNASAHVSRDSVRNISASPLFSGLRTTADVVIVCGAFVFAFNWLGANSSAVATPAREYSSSDTQTLSVAGDQVDSAVTLLSSLPSVPEPASDNDPFGLRSHDSVNQIPQIVVVAINPVRAVGQGNASAPKILHSSDPQAIQARAQVMKWLSATAAQTQQDQVAGAISSRRPEVQVEQQADRQAALFSASAELPAESPVQAYEALSVVPPRVVDRPLDLKSPRLSRKHYQPVMAQDYLVLDEDDPFAQLVVISDIAILEQAHDSVLPPGWLRRGERVLALSTNGEWFRIRAIDGIEGYVHHSQVAVEALSSLSKNRAG